MTRHTVRALVAASFVLAGVAAGISRAETPASPASDSTRLRDNSDGTDWAAYGRTYGEQHYSPLTEISTDTIGKLGLAWSMDLGDGNPATIPLAVDGVLYFANGLSVMHAVDAATGKLLWTYDPDVAEVAGHKMRQGWGSRGIAWWDGKVYSGTADGRLIAIDAKTGKPVWSVLTVDKDDGRYITGAPRVFDGKIIIGHGGADSAPIRGYVTTYDAETGKQLWRFYLVPGNPADGFEDQAQAMAAKTWAGEWWKYGGGGNVWNAMTYDAETDTILLGTGNGAPWNRRVRSADKGDNLFLCSIVALDAKTGAYKWHYQINPGESWDYNAAMDIQLAKLTIDGKPRKVLIQAPKNGFLYVIDRLTGKLISARKIAKVTWATKIDLATGRPIEVPDARYPNGKDFVLWPSPAGAHSWMPSAYSPKAGLLFVPTLESAAVFNDRGIGPGNWTRTPGDAYDFAANLGLGVKDPLDGTGWLQAIDPAAQKVKWKLALGTMWQGGVLATAGDLVFEGRASGEFDAYEAATGKKLWHFDAQAPVMAAPITYLAHGKQYVTVLVGMGTSPSMWGHMLPSKFEGGAQAKRVLTFALGAAGTLPPAKQAELIAASDPDYVPNPDLANQGAAAYFRQCIVCHGMDAVSGDAAPDLRTSPIPMSAKDFDSVVRGGSLLKGGMPRFEEYDDAKLEAIRQYIRSRAAALRVGQ